MKRGFTLLELLVVISIIGILVAIGAVAFSTVQSKSRDGRRRSDMQQLQKAFEQYCASNNGYDSCGAMATSEVLPGGLPTDPREAVNPYVCNGDTTGYCACAVLEEAGSGNAGAPTDVTCDFGAAEKDYFCVNNLQ